MKYVFLFESVHRVMRAEKVLKEKGIAVDLIPVPREINSDCGVAVELDTGSGEETLKFSARIDILSGMLCQGLLREI